MKRKKGLPEKLFPTQKGFTLLELLVASFMTAIVVGFAGWGLVRILEETSKEEIKSLNKLNLNRGLDFIAQEVASAESINDPSILIPAGAAFGGIIESGTEQNVLILKLPKATDPIIYRIAKPDSSTVWRGPRAIYRWGPNLDSNGEYTDLPDSSGWQNRVLIDEINDQTPSQDKDPCFNLGWTYSPTSDRKGFFSCVDNNRIAYLFLERKVEKKAFLGKEEDIVTTTTTQVFARVSPP
jgi:prepilin-type N-terminal cleavage/methylation domain-containing protein